MLSLAICHQLIAEPPPTRHRRSAGTPPPPQGRFRGSPVHISYTHTEGGSVEPPIDISVKFFYAPKFMATHHSTTHSNTGRVNESGRRDVDTRPCGNVLIAPHLHCWPISSWLCTLTSGQTDIWNGHKRWNVFHGHFSNWTPKTIELRRRIVYFTRKNQN